MQGSGDLEELIRCFQSMSKEDREMMLGLARACAQQNQDLRKTRLRLVSSSNPPSRDGFFRTSSRV